MKVLQALGALAALLLVASCSTEQLPPGASVVPSASNALVLTMMTPGYPPPPAHPDHGKSWMSPASKSIKYLLYVSDAGTGDVDVYDYTNGKQVGTLTGFDGPNGQCVDAKGDVYIANSENGIIVEYAHGGSSPLKAFSTNGEADGCTVDGKGDLAATDFQTFTTQQSGQICVWKRGRGKATCYQEGKDCFFIWPAGYDDKGNLIAVAHSYQYERTDVCGLLSGATSMVRLSFSEILDFYGGATMWDGKYIALSDQSFNSQKETVMYRVTLSGSTLTDVGETVLTDASCDNENDVAQPFVVGEKNTPVNRKRGKTVIGSNVYCYGSSASIDLWHYPKGANPYKNYEPGFDPAGQSVSIAP